MFNFADWRLQAKVYIQLLVILFLIQRNNFKILLNTDFSRMKVGIWKIKQYSKTYNRRALIVLVLKWDNDLQICSTTN